PKGIERLAALLDENRRPCAAGQGLQAERSAAGVEVGDPGVDDRVTQRREDRLANPVGGGPCPRCVGGRQPPPPRLARDDPHQLTKSHSTRSPSIARTSSARAG